jgi:hypothetical protein
LDHPRLERCKSWALALMLRTRSRFIFSELASKRIVLCAMLIGLCIAGYYVARFVYIAVLFSSVIGSHNIIKDSVVNSIGDEIGSTSELSERLEEPIKTTVWLKLAHHWFSTTLLTAESGAVRWEAKWLNDHDLEVTIGFGCLVHVTDPVSKVGSIRIIYQMISNDPSLGTCAIDGQRRPESS